MNNSSHNPSENNQQKSDSSVNLSQKEIDKAIQKATEKHENKLKWRSLPFSSRLKIIFRDIVIGILIGITICLIVGSIKKGSPQAYFQDLFVSESSEGILIQQKNVPYTIGIKFGEILLEEAQREKKLIVMRQNAQCPYTYYKGGLFNWDVFSQTKGAVFYGVGTYTVDFSKVDSNNFIVDDEKRLIEIHIPMPELSVEFISQKSQFFDTKNGWLTYGELSLTPEQHTKVEVEASEQLYDQLSNDKDATENAIKFAALSVKELYEPIVENYINETAKNAGISTLYPIHYSINVIVDEATKPVSTPSNTTSEETTETVAESNK